MSLRQRRWCAVVIVGVAAINACTSETSTVPPVGSTAAATASINPFRIGRTLVIPHGGGDGQFPEDTIYAYDHSLAQGGDVVDVDVRLAGDSVPMAIHDATVDRTTDGAGSVADLTSAELGRLDAGWGFQLDGAHPFRGVGIHVPTLEAVLRRFADRLTTIDLKDERVKAVDPLCALLRRLGRTIDVYIGVETDEQVARFRSSCPEVHTSGTSAERRASRAARESNDLTFVSRQLVGQPTFIGDDGKPRVTETTLAFAHRNDTAVLTYVVDDPKDMATLIDLGVDGIYTRHPDVLAKLVREHDAIG